MNKRDRIDYILSLVKEQTDEFLEAEEISSMDLSVEELIVAAVEIVTHHVVNSIEYASPIGRVDLDNVSFVIDDELHIQLTSTQEEEYD